MVKEIINSDQAPAPIGPYNQAVKAGNLLFVSGQIAIVPSTGELLNGTVEEETTLVLNHVEAILKEAGSDLTKVLKTTIFIIDMKTFATINEVYSRFFTAPFPARETVEVAGLPKGVRVEISVIALV
jgi:2-iminobutanoate/2-iminopropanoate deaminase